MDQQWIQTIVLALVGAVVALTSRLNARKKDDSPAVPVPAPVVAPTKAEIKGVVEAVLKDVLPDILENCLPSYRKEADCATKVRAHIDLQVSDRLRKIDHATQDNNRRIYDIQKRLTSARGERPTHPVLAGEGGPE